MSERLRLAPALLIVALGVALSLHLFPSRAGSAVDPAPTRGVGGVAITVRDMDRSVAFYSTVLFFKTVSDVRMSGPKLESRLGVAGTRVRVVTMRLGAEHIELVEYLRGKARSIPADAPTGGRGLQQIAIVVNDVDQAYLWLRRHHVAGFAPEPPPPPDSNPSAGGIRVVRFEDPDGHALAIVQFPPGKGDARWQRPSDSVFLGVDHAAIVVKDTERSLRFYRDTLGLRVVGGTESHEPEQELLNGVPGARLRTTALRAAEGPAIELLEYLDPRDGRPDPRGTMRDELARWRTVLVTTGAEDAAARLGAARSVRGALTAEDPDGYEVELRAR
jgi:catechol 2,3-dioxygenase-like lactoylglutathione lyase family enzyme